MKRFLSPLTQFLVPLLCTLFLHSPPSIHAAETLQKVRLAYASVTAAFAVPWVAKEAGIFRRHGLDVEIVYIASGPRTIQTLVAGGVDVAVIADPRDFVEPRLIREIEASGFIKRLYGEQPK